MNKIRIANNQCFKEDLNNIKVTFYKSRELFEVPKLKITILDSTDIELIFAKEDIKLDIKIDVLKGNSKLYEKRISKDIKIKYEINVGSKATLYLDKFSNSSITKELDVINLKGDLFFNQKTIAQKHEQYDLLVNHLEKGSKCFINNNGVTIKDGELIFNVTNVVPNGIKKVVIEQKNQIINENGLNSTINPNLLIDEQDVEANHSAYIGPFNKEEIFYLESRGIDRNNALNILIKGFMLKNMFLSDENKVEIKQIIDKYWR